MKLIQIPNLYLILIIKVYTSKNKQIIPDNTDVSDAVRADEQIKSNNNINNLVLNVILGLPGNIN